MIAYKIFVDDTEIYNGFTGENIGIKSASLKLEANKVESFSFTMLGSYLYAGLLQVLTTNVAVYMAYLDDGYNIIDEYWPFIGRITDISRSMYDEWTVECEGLSAVLNDIYIPYYEGKYVNFGDVLSHVEESYQNTIGDTARREFTFSSRGGSGLDTAFILTGDHSDEETKSITYKKAMDFIEEQMLNNHSALLYFVYDYSELGRAKVKYTYIDDVNPGFDYKVHDDGMPGRSIWNEETAYGEFPSFGIGVNILDISKDAVKAERYSGILPVGKDGLTLDNSEDITDNDIVWNSDLIEKYGKVYKVVDFSEIDSTSYLEQVAESYLQKFANEYGDRFTITGIEPCVVYEDVKKLMRIGGITVIKDIDNKVYIMPCLSISLDLFDLQNNEYVMSPLIPQAILSEEITAI